MTGATANEADSSICFRARRTIERPVMNTTLLLNQASKEVERAKTQAAVDAKAAQLAHELARAAKVNLKHARKLSKMARKSARKAEDRAEDSSVTLETAQAKLEMLRERIRNEQHKNNPSSKPSCPRRETANSRAKRPWTRPRECRPFNRNGFQSRSPTAHMAPVGCRRKLSTANPQNLPRQLRPNPNRFQPPRQKLGDPNPLPAPAFCRALPFLAKNRPSLRSSVVPFPQEQVFGASD